MTMQQAVFGMIVAWAVTIIAHPHLKKMADANVVAAKSKGVVSWWSIIGVFIAGIIMLPIAWGVPILLAGLALWRVAGWLS